MHPRRLFKQPLTAPFASWRSAVSNPFGEPAVNRCYSSGHMNDTVDIIDLGAYPQPKVILNLPHFLDQS